MDTLNSQRRNIILWVILGSVVVVIIGVIWWLASTTPPYVSPGNQPLSNMEDNEQKIILTPGDTTGEIESDLDQIQIPDLDQDFDQVDQEINQL